MNYLKNEDELNEILEYENGKVIIDFYADWCGPCQMLSPILEEINKEGDVSVYKINIDEASDLAAKYGVMSIPTLMFFNNKKHISTLLGLRRKEDLLAVFGNDKESNE